MARSPDQAAIQRPAGSHHVVLRSTSAEQTWRLGALLGALLAPGDVVLIVGDLGAGKTVFAQGIGAGLGVTDTINSPTFTLLKEYQGRVPLYHFDLYRIESPDELAALGFEDYFGGEGVCVVEWAERGEIGDGAETIWPENWLRIELRKVSAVERALWCMALGRRGRALLAELGRVADGEAVTGTEEER